VPFVGPRLAAGVSKHVRVRLEAKPCRSACALDCAGEAACSEWRAWLRGEHERRRGLLLAMWPVVGLAVHGPHRHTIRPHSLKQLWVEVL
jgi:hypothetical protein